MKSFLKIASILLITATLAGCCHCRSYQRKTRRPLVGTEWQLIQLGGQKVQPVVGRFTLTLLAEGGRVSGVGACNRLTGSFTTDDKRALKIGPLGSTRMACPDLELEQHYLRALESATHYDMDGPMLILLSNGEVSAIFQSIQH